MMLKTFKIAVLAIALFGASVCASAQSSLYSKVSAPWFPQGKISGGISVSAVSAATALPTVGLQAWICNTGASDAYLAFGTTNAIVATVAGGSWIKAGACGTYDLFALSNQQMKFIAAITASSTTTLAVETGAGAGGGGSGGGGGGGLSVTDQAAFTQGTSRFTPGGGVYNDTATLTAGQQGTFRMTTKRAQIVDIDSSGSQFYTTLNSGVVQNGSAVPATSILTGLNIGGTGQGWNGTNIGGAYHGKVDIGGVAGVAVPARGLPTVNGASTYNTVAASATAQALTGGGGGALGDYLSHCNIIPATTSPGNVILLDNATSITLFAGGASSVTSLIPFPVPIGALSVSGAWKITTGANVSVVCVGKFT